MTIARHCNAIVNVRLTNQCLDCRDSELERPAVLLSSAQQCRVISFRLHEYSQLIIRPSNMTRDITVSFSVHLGLSGPWIDFLAANESSASYQVVTHWQRSSGQSEIDQCWIYVVQTKFEVASFQLL